MKNGTVNKEELALTMKGCAKHSRNNDIYRTNSNITDHDRREPIKSSKTMLFLPHSQKLKEIINSSFVRDRENDTALGKNLGTK